MAERHRGPTMNLDELIEALQQQRLKVGGGIEVLCMWEGITIPITADRIYLAKDGGTGGGEFPTIYIDADNGTNHLYKKKFELKEAP